MRDLHVCRSEVCSESVGLQNAMVRKSGICHAGTEMVSGVRFAEIEGTY
jgi:hypothetical protein